MNKKDKNKLIAIIISSILFVLEIFIKNKLLKLFLSLSVLIISGKTMIKKSISSIKNKNPFNENVLMLISVVSAFFIGEYYEANMITLFTQIGDFFQNYAMNKTRKSIAELMNIKPEFANVYKDNQWQQTNPENVNVGDTILIKVGEKIPLDSVVIEGESTVNMSAITGESKPSVVVAGSKLISGSINLTSILKAKVVSKYSNSTVAKIIELVENVSEKKSQVETFVSKFAYYYTPMIITLAFLTAMIPPIFMKQQQFLKWFSNATMLLVMSCPCGIIISIPLALFGGIGMASRNGILIKNSNYLEAMSNVKYALFDKTGTITKGVFKINKIVSFFEEITEQDILKIASHIEYYSKHPIAESIKQTYIGDIDLKLVKNIKEYQGLGLSAIFDDEQYFIGNRKFMDNNNINIKNNIDNAIYLAKNNITIGYLLVGDEIKQDISDTIKWLNDKHIETIMLSGDNYENVKQVAESVGFLEYYGELLPMDKVEKIEYFEHKLQNRTKNKLIFVGDGINDAPVLARADIGISMGMFGSDSAIEASDIVIMDDNLSKIKYLIELSKRVMRIIRENLIISLSSKLFILLITIFGYGNIWLAILGGEGMSIVAILNALRVFRREK